MAENISGFGSLVICKASNTFPIGFSITNFADDTDPFDVPSLQIGDVAMGLNGDLISWSKANPLKITISVVPLSQDDINLAILLEANRVGKGKIGAQDIITMNVTYPAGNFVQLINGIITDGSPFSAVSNTGRIKSKTYNFAFENKIGG